MYAERQSIALTTIADGSCTAYSGVITGRILSVIFTNTDFAAGVDLTITLEDTGEPILTLTDANASAVYYPRVPIKDEVGADALFAAGGTKQRGCVTAAQDRVKVVVAQGGNVKTGTIKIVVG